MPAHKLLIDNLVEDNYHLIAIHSGTADYTTAFLLNKYLNTQLSRTDFDLDFKYKSVKAAYVLYKFYDEENMTTFYLVNNKFKGVNLNNTNEGSLFQMDWDSITTHLLPEHKKVDYFLKIEDSNNDEEVDELLFKIKKIPQITTAYMIAIEKIKNQENLIFE
ncbi:MAG TPA: IPExxxVDY family protein [Salinimicrobium sp.]|nr:IPExxxVDY family protein [Salinimicrobium sp.]